MADDGAAAMVALFSISSLCLITVPSCPGGYRSRQRLKRAPCGVFAPLDPLGPCLGLLGALGRLCGLALGPDYLGNIR